MDDPDATSAELAALTASRKAVIESFNAPLLVFPPPRVTPDQEPDRSNPGLSQNPVSGGSGLGGYANTVVTLFDANGDKATAEIPAKNITVL